MDQLWALRRQILKKSRPTIGGAGEPRLGALRRLRRVRRKVEHTPMPATSARADGAPACDGMVSTPP
jgi:hypothetical protein